MNDESEHNEEIRGAGESVRDTGQASDLDVREAFENGSWPTPPGEGWWTCRAQIEGASYDDDSPRPTIEYRCNWRAVAVADFGRDGPFDLDDLAVVIGKEGAA